MRIRTLLKALVFGVVLGALATGQIKADELYGRIRGTVTDPTGAVVPGVRVMVTNTATGISRTMNSSAAGDFEFINLLAPGVYNLDAQKEGFRKFQTGNIQLNLNQIYVVSVRLELGSTAQAVTVEANTAQVNTTSMQLGTAITGTTIQDMPLNGRNWLQLQQLQPGVVGASDRFGVGVNGTGFSTNGAQTEQNSFYMNGLDIADVSLNTAGVRVSPDAIGEFQLITSTINPEYGRNSGAVMNAVIKNGTNSLHGDGFEFVRDRGLDARNSLTNLREPYHQNQFGATVGGPVGLPHLYNGRNKTFFFFSYQGLRSVAPQTFNIPTVFSASQRNGAFPGLATSTGTSPIPMTGIDGTTYPAGTAYSKLFPTGQIPQADLNPLAVKLMNDFVPTSSNADNSYNFSPSITQLDDEYITRIDQNIGSRDSIWGYFLWERNPDARTLPFQGGTLPGFAQTDPLHMHQYAAAWNHTFTPTTINEVRFGYFRYNFAAEFPTHQISPTAYGFTGIDPQWASVSSIPLVSVTGLFKLGFSIYGPQPRIENTYHVVDNFSMIVGKHTLKAGFTMDRFGVYNPYDLLNNGDFSFNKGWPYSTGIPGADFLLGLPKTYTQSNGGVTNARSREYYSYVQDQWKLRPNLTLTIGTGWDIETPYINLYNKGENVNAWRPGVQSKVFPTAPVGILWPGDPGINSAGGPTTKYTHLAPRVGFAWSPDAARKWSVHAGFGIYYNRTEEEVALQNLTTPPFSLISFGVGDVGGYPSFAAPFSGWCKGAGGPRTCSETQKFPFTAPTGGNFDFTTLEPLSINSLSPNFGVPMAENYNLTIERQVTSSMTFTVGYVGSMGHHLEGNYELNPGGNANGNLAAAAAGCDSGSIGVSCGLNTFRYDPTIYAAIDYQDTSFNSNYNSLQVSATQKFRHGLMFQASYTWSRNFDFNSMADNQNGIVVPGINPFNFRSMYGPSDNDAPQRFVFSYDYTLPIYQFVHKWRPLTDGWKVAGILAFQKGFPVPIADSNSPSLTCSPGDAAGNVDVPCWDRPNRTGVAIGIGDPRNYVVSGKGNYWFNPAAFSEAATGTFGNAGRNPLYGPGINNFDTTFIKDIHITESKYIELRCDTFNTFNHQQWGPPVNTNGTPVAPTADIASSDFGRIRSIRSNFIAQLAAKIYF